MAMGTPDPAVAEVRRIALALPETREDEAWVGVRWRIRQRTFAHVLTIDAGWPPAYARASGTDGPATVLMFRSSPPELDALKRSGHPFFACVWRSDEVGMLVDGTTDWHEVEELVTESYCLLAPKRLAEQVERPSCDEP